MKYLVETNIKLSISNLELTLKDLKEAHNSIKRRYKDGFTFYDDSGVYVIAYITDDYPEISYNITKRTGQSNKEHITMTEKQIIDISGV